MNNKTSTEENIETHEKKTTNHNEMLKNRKQELLREIQEKKERKNKLLNNQVIEQEEVTILEEKEKPVDENLGKHEKLIKEVEIKKDTKQVKLEKKLEEHQKIISEANKKLETKKQKLLKEQEQKRQYREYILNTKIALKNEKLNRKTVESNVRQLDKANETYKETLATVQTDLDNEIFKLANTKQELEKEVQQTQDIQLKVKEIEEEREKTSNDNLELQTILENKQNDIISTVEELNTLNKKTRNEYDLLVERRNQIQSKIKELSELKVPKSEEEPSENPNKAVENYLRNVKHKENVRMKKYDEKKKQFIEKQQRLNDIKNTKLALRQEQLDRKDKKINVNVLEKSNNIYSDKLVQRDQLLSNDLVKLENTNRELEHSLQVKNNIEEEIRRIEQEREKVKQDNKAIQDFLIDNKTTIQYALNEVSEISSKTNNEYKNILQEKKKYVEDRKQSELKLALLKKYA